MPKYALFSIRGNPLSLDPASNQFSETTIEKLKIWDVLPYDDPGTWFMGNSPRPKMDYIIRQLSAEEELLLAGTPKRSLQ